MTTPILHISRVPISHIELNDFSYSILPFKMVVQPDNLIEQINKTGILPPPVVKEQGAGSYSVVSGWQSLATAQAMSLSSIDCFIVPAETTDLNIFTIVLSETISQHTVSPIEKAVFFQKVTQICSMEEAVKMFLPLLNLPQRSAVITQLLSLVNLEQPISEAVHKGQIAEKAAYELAKMSFRDRMILFEAISDLRLSVSNQRKLINYCTDLSLRNESSILAIFSSDEVQEIINHKEANPPQKAANLMSFLESALSPRLAEATKSFNSLKNSLKLPKWATLSHATAFEKDALTLSLTFKNNQSLSEFCKTKLSSNSRKDEI